MSTSARARRVWRGPRSAATRGEAGSIEQLFAEEKNKKSPRKPPPEIVIKTFPEAILAGAIGAALLGAFRYEQLQKKGRPTGAHAQASV